MRRAALALALLTLAAWAPGPDVRRPPEARFGATVAQTQAALAGRCKTIRTRRIDPPFAPDVRREQLQIDCDGLVWFGAPRWAEFVFRDDSLEMVWIMVKAEDEAAILAAMTAAHGPLSHRGPDYIAFTQAGAAWRFKPAEVVFYSPAFAPWMEADF
ncbi:hypothetical protein QO010_001026 [Caulobacter ginsengisoli]|uniref:Uncharacterized protein n=1 Tax=Caulobacter ginsengisoli TaxID=400775 RepID=A0ABU0IMN6_9CAUL|nr:hypothetical protein [Caulobacter ginsengisoli]MDQ0463278.1 hypothetical protein [Caulobacter ginsengisoli]